MIQLVAHHPRPAPLAPGTVLGRMGGYQTRLARDESEIAAAQALRFRAFLAGQAGMGAPAPRDEDRFDGACDHLVVTDAGGGIVGTYRLLRQERAAATGGFYSADEFDVAPLFARNPAERFLELGRSCVDAEHRGRGAVEAMWAGIWAYVGHHQVSAMIGCASFPGTTPARHAEALSLLHHEHGAPPQWHVRARPDRFRETDWMPAEAIDRRAARNTLPALIRGYLRLGAVFGEGCVVDEAFGTTDVFVALPVGRIGHRYINYYGGGLANTRRAA